MLNIYGPYEDMVPFWEALSCKSFLKKNNLIVGGDLNFSLETIEVCGPRVRDDPLTDFFQHFILEAGLLDVAAIKLSTTWRNKRTWEDLIVNILDHFLIADHLLHQPLHIRQWIGNGGDFNHSPIFLDLSRWPEQTPNPFEK